MSLLCKAAGLAETRGSLIFLAKKALGPSSTTLVPTCVTPWKPQQQQHYSVSIEKVTKHLELISTHKLPKVKENLEVGPPYSDRPLTLLFSWMMSKRKHRLKYATLYLDQGFDVLTVSLTPFHLLWPAKGSQKVAEDVLQFLHANQSYNKAVVHGFSVGAYMFGEVLVKMSQDPKHLPLLGRFVGQIWDSIAGVEEIPVGLPHAMFPNNAVLRKSLETYIRYHMKAFHAVATRHYLASAARMYDTAIHAPALFLYARNDHVGVARLSEHVTNLWRQKDIEVFAKCWDKSTHVGHLYRHPEEYLAELHAFLNHIGLLAHPEKLKMKL